MNHTRDRLVLVAAAALCCAPGAVAQENLGPNPPPAGIPTPQPPGQPEPRYIQPTWTIEAEPAMWYVAPGGFIQLPGGITVSSELLLQDLNLDNPRPSPFMELHVREEFWRLTVSGVEFQTHGRGSVQQSTGTVGGQSFAPGTPVSSSLDFASFQVEAGYRLKVSGLLAGENVPDYFAMWEAVGGVRFINADFNLDLPTGHASGHEFMGAPYVGVKMTQEIVHGFTIDAEVNVGMFGAGDRSLYTNDICVGFMWRPWDNVGVQMGYRQIAFTMKSGRDADKFLWDGAMAGLYWGVVIRF